MIDGSGKRNRQLAFELQNSHVCEKRSNLTSGSGNIVLCKNLLNVMSSSPFWNRNSSHHFVGCAIMLEPLY